MKIGIEHVAAAAVVAGVIYYFTRPKPATGLATTSSPSLVLSPTIAPKSTEEVIANMAISELNNLIKGDENQGFPGISSGSSPIAGLG